MPYSLTIKLIAALSHKFDTIGFHVFELSHDQNITAHCRNFAPRYGINEESATGSSSGALGVLSCSSPFAKQKAIFVRTR